MQGLSLVFALFSLAAAFHNNHGRRAQAMSSLSFSAPIPSLSLSIPTFSIPSVVSPFSPSTSVPSSSPTPTSSTPTPTSSSSSSSTFSLSSSTPSSSSSSSTSLSSTSSTTTTSDTLAQQTDSAPTSTFPTGAGLSDPEPSSSLVTLISATITPSSTATNSASPSFFTNTGAVAGTFTVVGLVSIAGVIAVALLIIRRRHSRSYEEDMEYLDKSPNRSSDLPMNQVISADDGFTSEHGHYTASPMVASPPTVYYPDNAYALHPQAFSPDPSGSHGYPTGYTQDYAAQHIYSPDDYHIGYPPSTPHIESNMPNPHGFSDVELASTPVPPAQAAPPDVLRPSVKSAQSTPKQWENTRFSVDSFYAGIATDYRSPTGRAL